MSKIRVSAGRARAPGTGTGIPATIGTSSCLPDLENAGGAWSGTFTSADGPSAVSSGFLVGEEGYEGLTYYWHQDMGDEIERRRDRLPGDPPTP